MKRLIGLTSGQKIEHIFAGKNSRETWEQFIVYLNAQSKKRKIVAALKGRRSRVICGKNCGCQSDT